MKAEDELQRWLSAKTGIELTRGGVHRTLAGVVERRCRELGCDLAEYVCRVQQVGSTEFDLLANSITVVYTWFFRDPQQLAAVEELMRRWTLPRAMRIWIPGCATGEDPYSIAMIADRLGVPVTILGTDLNAGALSIATEGRYSTHDLRNLEPDQKKYFIRRSDGSYSIAPAIRQRVSFRRQNLVDAAPELDGSGSWDLVLCRNVFIYFEPVRAYDVFYRLTRALHIDGHLLLGASEIVYEVPIDMEAVHVAHRVVLARREPRRPSTVPPTKLSPGSPHPIRASAFETTRGTGGSSRRMPLLMSSPPPPPSSSPRAAKGARSDKDNWLQRGHAMLEESRVADAVELYTHAIAADPVSAEALMYRGVARYLCGDVELAAKDLRAAQFLDDQLWLGTYYLALSYESMGLADDALREFRHVVRVGGANIARSAPPQAQWAGWSTDILQLARRRLERSGHSA